MVNYTEIITNFFTWSTQGYETALGFYFIPLVFSGIIGYLYIKTESVTVASVAGIILIGTYSASGLYADVQAWVLFIQIIVTISTVGLIILFVSRWRR